MASQDQIQLTLDRMLQNIMELKSLLRADGQQSSPAIEDTSITPAPTSTTPTVPSAATAATSDSNLSSFEALKKALESPRWPEAVNTNLVCDPDSDRDKTERGRGILELMIEEDLANLKFLDMGCGEGHCAYLAHEFKPILSVGYDIKEFESWSTFEEKDNVVFTTDFDVVVEKGPYDVILLFDVIDHLQGEDPNVFLKKVASQLTPNGKIYMRTHPWISRHGTHLYHTLNKAYIHLIFTEDELRQIVPFCPYEEPSTGVKTPIATYNSHIEYAQLEVASRREVTEKVEPFFKIPEIANRICKSTGFDKLPEFQMGMQFIDYVLAKPK